jgi:uncharacterized DUF497 family protein
MVADATSKARWPKPRSKSWRGFAILRGSLRSAKRSYNLRAITYDENKRQLNIAAHGFDFVGCEAIFEGFTITREDRRTDYGEIRLQTLGLWYDVVVFVVHTPRGDADHVISIRKAQKHEAKIFWNHFPR